MGNTELTLVLVSNSPRRRELLAERNFRLEFASPPSDTVELSDGEATFVVTENARLKVSDYYSKLQDCEKFRKVYLGVDTIVVKDEKVLGKPENEKSAQQMLKSLSGRSHYVYTALHIIDGDTGRSISELCRTRVEFSLLSDSIIEQYVQGGDPLDKAGSYGIQGFAGLFVSSIEGCYYNVVGLPLSALCRSLNKLGHNIVSFMV